jgi:phospholipid/cholesterol/gamma-HCH transport system ATP-binding protein
MPEENTHVVPAIELSGIRASSGTFEILSGVDIPFHEGKTSVVLGTAGSGKSTLIKTAAGLIVPDQGRVRFRGKDIFSFSRSDESAFRAASGFVFQDAALWANTNILNNILMPLRVHKPWMGQSEMAETARLLLARLGYDEGLALRPADLSAGEQKLVSIARALIHDPWLVFMDDPVSNLDEEAADRVYTVLDELRAKGKTLIIGANNSELAYRFADYLGVVKAGRIAIFGTYDQTVAGAEEALSASISRLKARGGRKSAVASNNVNSTDKTLSPAQVLHTGNSTAREGHDPIRTDTDTSQRSSP